MTVSPDARVLFFTGGAALAGLLLFAFVPARQASRVDLAGALKSASRSVSHAQNRSRRILVCAQVALSLVLVTGACLFIATLHHLRDQSLGFRVEDVLDVQLAPLPGGRGPGFDPATYYRDLMERLQSLPGVKSVSRSHFSPLFTVFSSKEEIRRGTAPDAPAARAHAKLVSDNFLATMRIPLLQGRDFRRGDSPQSQKTGIVSESLAGRLFPAGQALGQHIRVDDMDLSGQPLDVEIVGVAADARLWDPRANDLSFLYLNLWQFPGYQVWGDFQLRYSGEPGPLMSAVRDELRRAGHHYALHLRTIADQRDIALLRERLLAALGTAYGVLALALAGIGVFGLLSFLVTSRTGELGIRVALGAQRGDIAWLVMREAFVLVGAGLLIGLPLSYASVRTLSGLLYGVGAAPVVPAFISMTVLLAVTAVATVIPVRRATSVDPMAVLRHE